MRSFIKAAASIFLLQESVLIGGFLLLSGGWRWTRPPPAAQRLAKSLLADDDLHISFDHMVNAYSVNWADKMARHSLTVAEFVAQHSADQLLDASYQLICSMFPHRHMLRITANDLHSVLPHFLDDLKFAGGPQREFQSVAHLMYKDDIYDELVKKPINSPYLNDILNRVSSLEDDSIKPLVFSKLVKMPLADIRATTSENLLSLAEPQLPAELDPRMAKYFNVVAPAGDQPLLKLYIQACADAWAVSRINGYHAPYFAVIQGSGAGKTTMVMHCQGDDMLVLYLCLRKRGASGLPPRSAGADLFLRLHTVEEYRWFYVSVIKVLQDLIAGEVHQAQGRQNVLQYLHDVAMGLESEGKFWDLVDKKYHLPRKQLSTAGKEVDMALLALWSSHPSLKSNPPQLVFALDEARALTTTSIDASTRSDSATKIAVVSAEHTLFAMWRRSIQISYGRSRSLFFVLMDTSSTVGNFYPAPDNDPSARVVSRAAHLFPPFYLFPFTGPWTMLKDPTSALYKNSLCLQVTEDIVSTTSSVAPTRKWSPYLDIVVESRPLYWSLLSQTNDWDDVLDMALSKLGIADEINHNSDPLSYMPILCYRFGLLPQHRSTAEKLLSSCSASLVAMVPSEGTVGVCYVPEPVFGEVTAGKFHKPEARTFLLNMLANLVVGGQVGRAFGKGNKGEFAGMVYMSMVMDAAQRTRAACGHSGGHLAGVIINSRPIVLGDFVCALTGLNRTILDANSAKLVAELDHYAVAFTGWSDARDSPSPSCLASAYSKRISWALQPGETACDLIIPTISLANTTTNNNNSLVAIQVKNWAKDLHIADIVQLCNNQISWAKAIRLIEGDTKMVSVLLLAGNGKFVSSRNNITVDEDSRAVLFNLDGHICIVCNGFSSPHTQDVQAQLSSLSAEWGADPVQHILNGIVSKTKATAKSGVLQEMTNIAVRSTDLLRAWPRLKVNNNRPLVIRSTKKKLLPRRDFQRTTTVNMKIPVHPSMTVNQATLLATNTSSKSFDGGEREEGEEKAEFEEVVDQQLEQASLEAFSNGGREGEEGCASGGLVDKLSKRKNQKEEEIANFQVTFIVVDKEQ